MTTDLTTTPRALIMTDIGQPVRTNEDGHLFIDGPPPHTPCHGFANGCGCGCKPGRPRGSAWTRNPERMS